MNRLGFSRLVFYLFLLTSAIFIWRMLDVLRTKWPDFLYAYGVSWITAAFTMAYNTFPVVYLAVNRFLAIVLNKHTHWEVVVEYEIPEEVATDALTTASSIVLKSSAKAEIWDKDENQKIIKLPDFSVRIRYSSDIVQEITGNSSSYLSIDFTNMSVPYREVEHILHKELSPLFDSLHEALDPEWVKYTLRINYGTSGNPFFGLYVRQLPPDQIAKFNCEMFETFGQAKENITIQKENTVINATSANNFLLLSKKYLTLSTPVKN